VLDNAPNTDFLTGFGLGHNGGRAHEAVWKDVSYHTLLRRVAAAEALGLTYEEYVLELLFNGRHLQREDQGRIAAIRAARKAQ
jgi:hypothetical protein